jgi:transcriptional regulator with XRE-family HTH domain
MLGDRIRECLDELGIDQSEAARRTQISTSYLSDLIHGKRGKQISGATLNKLASGLGKPVEFFYPINPQRRIICRGRTSVLQQRVA